MGSRLRTRTTVVVAIAAAGIAGLAGCSGLPAPQHTILTTKSAGEYYAATACHLNIADDAFSIALLNAQQATESTGPDLDSLKAAALTYQKASREALVQFADKKIVWPNSVRKSMAILIAELRNQIPPLGEMANGTQMSDEQAGYQDLPDNSAAVAAVKDIHSKLGLSDAATSCSAPTPAAITVPPATGIVIQGTGYSFHAPAGWTLPSRPTQADSYAISARPDANGVYDTVNVLLGELNTDTLVEQQQRGAEYLEQVVGATQVKIRPLIDIAGEASVHISSLQTHQGVTEWSEQYSLSHGKTTFTITLAFNQDESQPDREAVANSVLASWTWG